MTEKALIVFVRKPVAGSVKTRLASAIGPEAALAIYLQLLAHTHAVILELPCDKYLFYAGEIDEADQWREGFVKRQQSDGNLGERMKAAFAALFRKGYRQICIIGSDCFELTAETISTAFAVLQQKDVVLGPAKDGGYYLLGMKGGVKEVFDDVDWSTEKVFSQTVEKIKQQGLSFSLLPLLSDVDTVDDVPEDLLRTLRINRANPKS